MTTQRLGFTGSDLRLIGICLVAGLATYLARSLDLGDIVPFVIAAVALALLATLVGRSVEALGNLPELFVALFALNAGLVIVAIAGNAVENVVGIQLAARNRADYALSVILQSPVQIALVLAPVLVLAAPLVGAVSCTLVLPPLLIAALVLAVIVTVIVVFDGESNWFEGISLIALYGIIAAAFWWG